MSETDYVKVCPSCGTHNAPQIMRCTCGALLAGIDLTRPASAAPADLPEATPRSPVLAESVGLQCQHADCAQSNPPGTQFCLYCNRPLSHGATLGDVATTSDAMLIHLPAALKSRYRVRQVLEASGAEAELMMVEPLQGGSQLIAKVYRKGIQPKAQVRERVRQVDERYRVRIFEEGNSDGYAYEVMEFCSAGSLRKLLTQGLITPETITLMARELSAGLAALHAVDLVHRDLKPENVLMRSRQPLQLVLTDFGISSVLDATQRFTGNARTLSYASPESLSGVIDSKYDYWSLGMILLEAALGRHPFASLSDPVILHHLTTRSVDLSGVRDLHLRKLLRGLLLRDPKFRWSAQEVKRWLEGDPTLMEPVDQGGAMHFAQPYRLAGELCSSPLELANALSRHWPEAVADIANGQLLAWFHEVQKDQDAVRLLGSLQKDNRQNPDFKVLRLITHLAPGLPPAWKGQNVDLRSILTMASQALKGSAEATRWLDTLYANKVLEFFAAAGDEEAQTIGQRWQEAADMFDLAWERRTQFMQKQQASRQPNRVVNFDEMMYGQATLHLPVPTALHPRLLAVTYDPAWSVRLRLMLLKELTPLLVVCPWLVELGDPAKLEPVELLVLEFMLPAARTATEQQQRAQIELQENQKELFRQLSQDYALGMSALGSQVRRGTLSVANCEQIEAQILSFFELLSQLRAGGAGHKEWLDLRRKALRVEPVASRIQELVEKIAKRRAITAGFLNWRVAAFFACMVIFLPEIPGTWPGFVLLLASAGLIIWRLLPNYWLKSEIRSLGEKLPR